QSAAIAVLVQSGELAALTPVLRQTAHLRLENPEMPLSELAEAGGVSRPTLAGRLRRLVELAEAVMEPGVDRRPRP
ncbi:MAG: helix-turn-helix domain-containing protein, partial [Gaiellales bacterium]